MRWDQGRAGIDRMLADAELQRVPPSRDQADSLIAQARIHLTSAASICDQDPPGASARDLFRAWSSYLVSQLIPWSLWR
jgi:hypothetical protein